MSEYIRYKGIPTTITAEQSIELQKRILGIDSSVGYMYRTDELRTHSAVKAIEKKLSIKQALELQKKIVGSAE